MTDAGTDHTAEPTPEELRTLARLRAGDESAFAELVERHQAQMLRVALGFVSSRAVAEEVVQEAWLGVLRGLERFEGRSSLRTWIFRILTNTAKTRGQRESRSVPFSSLAARDDEAAVDADRFLPPDREYWASPPNRWDELPEGALLAHETGRVVVDAIALLPASQQAVITLRDLHGWSSGEVCNALELAETNQRVLLHRARSKVRAALEAHFDDEWTRQR